VIVNASAKEFGHKSRFGGEVELPPFGFVVESPTFIAFHALSWNGLHYDAPVLFTVTALDGKSFGQTERVRVFHAFGDARLKWRDSIESVEKEVMIQLSQARARR
jgi:hypothetical protein